MSPEGDVALLFQAMSPEGNVALLFQAMSPEGDVAFLFQAMSPEWDVALLLHHFIGTATRGKRIWLGPESKTHAGDIAHGIAQGIVAFK
jgi:hypothetical protein